MTEIRRITAEELGPWLGAMATAFHETFDPAAIVPVVTDIYDLERVWGAFDGARPVGTLRTWATELTVPGGGRVPASGVSAVTVLATHRRRGLLTGMIAAEHAANRERGEAVSLLYASEYPIYGRFGYGAAVQTATWTVDALAARVRGAAHGTVDYAAPTEARGHLVAVYDAHRRAQVGELWRRDFRWDFDLGLRTWPDEKPWAGRVVLHRDAVGTVDGYAKFKSEDKWEQRQPRYTVEVDELIALNDAAYLDLWRFLLEQDLVSVVRAERRRPDEPLPWILENARNAAVSEVGDGLFASLIDVPAALAARTYARQDELVLEVAGGALGADRRERVRLEAGEDGAACAPSDALPDLTLDAAALGAVYLGGPSLRTAVLAGGAEEHTPGALRRADTLFRMPDAPWCTTFF